MQEIWLEPGEQKTVRIHLPQEAFGLYDENGKLQIREGKALVFVGGHAPTEEASS